jgi:peptide/nickel transport system substrate-binding protein
MYKKGYTTGITIYMIAALGIFSCKNAPEISSLAVTIRLPNEPESLHPIFSKSIYAAPIESLILLPVAEYDPVSLSLTPLLIRAMPVGEKVIEGKHANGKVFKLEFRPEATWADGKPVTAEDYLFTFKSVYNPHVNAGTWKGFMDNINGIEIDPQNPKKVSVYMDNPYVLELEATTNFNIYPAHIYDPENIMSKFTLEELREKDKVWTAEQDTLLKRFATLYESPEFFRETVSGAGPYELDQWVTGEFIRLKRKENWWGDKIENGPLLLQAYPTEINYKFILDAAAAEAAMKTGETDLMTEVPVASFNTLRHDPQWKEKLQFATPSVMQVNYLGLNTRDSILADPKIRQALAYSIDYDGMIANVMQGLAKRTIGPIHPNKRYYNKDLIPIQQDINRSLLLIKEAGWSDTNGDGTPDKMIGGKKQELHLEIKITNKEEGMAIANIIKDNGAKAGFDIAIVVVEPGQLGQDVRQNNYQIMPLRIRPFPGNEDPLPFWHSSNDKAGGSNRSGFHSPEMDKVLEDLQAADDDSSIRYYKIFQEIIFEQQPEIYLYVPLERIIASKRIELQTSPRRPGYFENLLRPAGS